jgi:hypothetical protein
MRRVFWNGLAVETSAIGAPGVVGSRRFGEWHSPVEVFGIHDLRLHSQLFVGGLGERFVLVQDGDFSFGVFTDQDRSLVQGISRALGLDLVDELVVLHSQVF